MFLPPLLSELSHSFHLLPFPIILLHWAEAFLLFSTINSKSFDIFHYFFCFFFFFSARVFPQHDDDDNDKSVAVEWNWGGRFVVKKSKKSSTQKSCPRLIFNHTRLAFHHTMDISLDSFSVFLYFFIFPFSLLARLLDFSFDKIYKEYWDTLESSRYMNGWMAQLKSKCERVYVSLSFLPSTCDTLLNSDWKLPIKLNWIFFCFFLYHIPFSCFMDEKCCSSVSF